MYNLLTLMERDMKIVWDFFEKIIQGFAVKVLGFDDKDERIQIFKQFIKFGIVGLSNTLISYIIYAILVAININYFIASILGFLISVLNSFYWNNKYVFSSDTKRNLLKVFMKTLISYAGTGLILANILLYVWIDIFLVHELIAPLFNLFITIPLNFLINKFWAYKK